MKNYESLSKLKNLNNIALIAHIEPDPDALSSMVVFKEFLEQCFNVKQVDIFSECVEVRNSLVHILGEHSLNPKIKKYDAVIMMDCPNTLRLGMYKEIFDNSPFRVVIDHHATNNFDGEINIVEICSSTCEIIYAIMKEYDYNLSTKNQGKLYAGIITDTNNFKVGAITNRTFKIVGEFAENIDREAIYNTFLANNTQKSMELLSLAINNISSYENGKIIITYITNEEAKTRGADHSDMCAIVNQIATINSSKLVCFIEPRGEKYHASMRAKKGYDVSSIASRNGGGGHVGAAAFVSEKSLDEIKELVLKEFLNQLKISKTTNKPIFE